MSTANKVMAKALSYLGTKEYPAGSNNVVFNTDYYGRSVYDGLNGGSYPWCCTFVWDVFRLADAEHLFYGGKKTASCIALKDWGKKAGLTVDKTEGKYGDIILFDWNGNDVPDHVGLIIYNDGDGNYTTIEGNTSVSNDSNGGEVMKRSRKMANVDTIIRPQYEAEGTGDNPSTWAKEACEWAKAEGIFVGDGKGNYDWQQPVTREQLAVILNRIK